VKDERSRDSLEGYGEEERLLLLLSGRSQPLHYGSADRKVDFLDIKGEVEALLSKFCLDKYRFISYDNGSALIESALAVEINGSYAGFLGKISKSIAERFDIDGEVYVCELRAAVVHQHWVTEKKLVALPRFPSVRRDLAFIVDADSPQERIESAIRQVGGVLVSRVILFDLYVGDQVGAGKKSLAYALELQPLDRTLTDVEADELVGRIVRHIESTCNAQLRSL
jgi:phenylalanyl-tRNA synthetase beta chain